MENEWAIISSYSRKQAIEDGILIDISEAAKECGFKLHTVITANVFADFPAVQPLLQRFRDEIDILDKYGGEIIVLTFIDAHNQMHEVVLHIGSGDDPTPVLTLMYPQDW